MKIPTHLQLLQLPPTPARVPAAPVVEQSLAAPAAPTDQVEIAASALQSAPPEEKPAAPPEEKPAPSAAEKKAEQRADFESRMRTGTATSTSTDEYHFADSNLNLRSGGEDPKVKVKITPKRNGGSADVKLDNDGQGVDLSGIKVTVGKKPGIGLTWDF
jgi:hypothetical protein